MPTLIAMLRVGVIKLTTEIQINCHPLKCEVPWIKINLLQ